ncbi:MAG: tetratricopeptide repeat protein [Acidobacteria bacterium]|nr:tetratricopeptide repeat protein [Acidobacteriota bacterium]
MTTTRALAVAIASTIVGAAVLAPPGVAEAARQPASPPQGAVALSSRAVALPDLSALHASVRQRLVEAHASLTAEAARPDAAPEAQADAWGEMGMLFLSVRFGDEAARCFENARRLAPGDARWPYYLGHIRKNTGDLAAAAASFERARELQPGDLATLVWLGRVLLDLARPLEAAEHFAQAAVVHPNQPVLRFELGRAALAQRDYARAVEYLSAALVRVPDATVIHYPLAMAYRGVGDLDRAAHHLERRGGRGTRGYTTGVAVGMPDPLLRALDGVIETPQSHRDRGLDAAALLDWPEAARHYRLAVEAEPDYAAMRVNLGTALERVGDARGALTEYDAALRLDPGLWEAWYGRGDLLERGGRDEEAIASYRSAIAENPTFVAAHLRLGDALRRTDRLEEALTHYRRVIALHPGDPGARFGEAMALVRLDRYAEARDRLEEALRVLPDQAMFGPALARVLAAAPDDAVRDGARAWDLIQGLADDQQHPGVFETLAMALAELGYFDLALDWQRLAMTTAARAGRADVAQRMAASLALYARRQPSRRPWRDDDPDHRPGPPVEPGLLDPVVADDEPGRF